MIEVDLVNLIVSIFFENKRDGGIVLLSVVNEKVRIGFDSILLVLFCVFFFLFC